jgi:nucleotide-binding universal stress UspA family protein
VIMVIWLVEGTWRSCVNAARVLAPVDAEVVLLHVTGDDSRAVAHGAFAGLLGRGHAQRDPTGRFDNEAEASAEELLRAAAASLPGPSSRVQRRGRIEREVVAAAEGADLLLLARDCDSSRLGPRSLGPASRFVVDHAPCPVLLVWPDRPPSVRTIPPPPRDPQGHPRGHPPGPPHDPPPGRDRARDRDDP